MDEYLDRFDATMAFTDALWTKPSELSFYAALGLPLVFAKPVGVHERYNRRWIRESGAGVVQRNPAAAWQWLSDWLEDGTLAGAAWSGFTRLPKHGLYRILDQIAPPPPAGEG
jgi:UDP-N-acetylglucosamine:LPS N-acetylglucosamine transferase